MKKITKRVLVLLVCIAMITNSQVVNALAVEDNGEIELNTPNSNEISEDGVQESEYKGEDTSEEKIVEESIPLENNENLENNQEFQEEGTYSLQGTEEVASGTCGDNLNWTLTSDGLLTISGTGQMFLFDTTPSSSAPWRDYGSAVKKLYISEGVTSIGNNAFRGCSSIEDTLQLPTSLIKIGAGAFAECSNLYGKLSLPNGLQSIGEEAFSGCYGFSGSLVIPDSVTSIGAGAFSLCTGFSGSLSLSDSLKRVENSTFISCTGFRGDLDIPNSVEYIGEYAFNSAGFNGILTLPDALEQVDVGAFAGSKISGSLIIPNSVKTIGKEAFSSCTNLTGNLVLSHNLTRIENRAFYYCNNLSGELSIPNSVEYIGEYAFYGCQNISGDLSIPSSTKRILRNAFQNCKKLTSLTIPASVVDLGGGVISGCTGLYSITNNSDCDLSLDGLGDWYNVDNPTEKITIICNGSAFKSLPVKVTYYSSGIKSYNSTQDVYYGKPYGNMPQLTAYGYTLSGWYTQSIGGELVTPETLCLNSSNHTLYAHWEVTKDTVTFDPNGGEVDPETKIVTYNEKYGELPTPIREGYSFVGWYTSSDGGSKIDANTTVTALTDHTLFAHWDGIKDIVTFDANGGSVRAESKGVEYGSAYGDLPIPNRKGYVFDGWFTDKVSGDKVTSDTIVEETSDHTIYAHWTEVSVTVTFNYQNGSTEQHSKVLSFDAYYGELPMGLIKEGYEFAGWFTSPDGGDLITSDSVVENDKDHVLYAHWKRILVKPRASITTGKSVVSGTEIKLNSPDDGRIYYTFDGFEPTEFSNLYTQPIILSSIEEREVTVKAIAVKDGYENSEVATFTYTVVPVDEGILGDIAPTDVPSGDISQISQGLWIAGINEGGYDFTGSVIKPEVRVYHYKTRLNETEDYSISYKNNKNAASKNASAKNAPTITVTGKGNYSGSISDTFTIKEKSLADYDITSENIITKYNRKVQKVAPKVYWNGKQLKSGTDYTVTYVGCNKNETGFNQDAFLAPGTYEIIITGKGNFVGELPITETITEATLMNKVSVSSISAQTYTGDEITLDTMGAVLTVKDGKKLLSEGVHYTVSYKDNIDIGDAYIILTGTGIETPEGTYVGTKSIKFKITGTALSKAKMTDWISSVIYSGETIEQEPVLTFDGNDLIEGEDYVVSYTNNTNAGTAKAVFTGINGFTGSIKKSFSIKKYDIANDEECFVDVYCENSYIYEKGGITPIPEVTFAGETLECGKDFTVSYKNNNAVNDCSNDKKLPTIVIKGKGSFSGSINLVDFCIEESDISDLEIAVPDVAYSTKKNGWKSVPVITDTNGKNLKAGTDYDKAIIYEYLNQTELENGEIRGAGEEILPTDIVPLGTDIKVTVTGINNYYGEIMDVYTVAEKSFAKVKITVASKTYTGSEVKLSAGDITVKDGNTVLVLNADYEIVGYSNNKNKGTALVTLKGMGAYAGTRLVKFTIKAGNIKQINDDELIRRAAEEAKPQTITTLIMVICKDGTCYVTAEQLTIIHATWDFAGDAIAMAGHHSIGELEAVIGQTIHGSEPLPTDAVVVHIGDVVPLDSSFVSSGTQAGLWHSVDFEYNGDFVLTLTDITTSTPLDGSPQHTYYHYTTNMTVSFSNDQSVEGHDGGSLSSGTQYKDIDGVVQKNMNLGLVLPLSGSSPTSWTVPNVTTEKPLVSWRPYISVK